MKTLLLPLAGLFVALAIVPALATTPTTPLLALTPITFAPTAPLTCDYEEVSWIFNTLRETNDLIAEVPDAPAALGKIGQGDVILAGILEEAADANAGKDAAGRPIIDCNGFAPTASRMLNNKHPELVKFAAAGWGITEKRASAKFDAMAKSTDMTQTGDAIIAILVGMVKATEEATAGMDSRPGVGILKSQDAAREATAVLYQALCTNEG
ncbi:MAG: hypothetical protein ABI743_09550 [bacterium]